MQPETSKEVGAGVVRASWAQALALALLVAVCYANSLAGPFLFDDPFLNAPRARLDYSWRPLVWASWDLNRALGGMETRGYHVFNALVHLGCGLLLLGVLRRAGACAAPGVAARTRDALAFVTACLWVCHPLQTAAVTYLSQRAEALGALFYLAVLYAFLRSAGAARRRLWEALALLALALGLVTKEILVTAPVVLFLADGVLVSGGWRAALRARRGFHAAAALLTLALAAAYVLPLLQGARNTGFGLEGLGPLEYARSQPGVILHYLRLAFWPEPLCFDYGWPVAAAAREWVPQSAALALLAGASLVLLVRRSWIGLAGAVFFLVLAPTSSFVPIKDLAFEHRMYLPLAAVLVLAVAGAWRLARPPLLRRALPFLAVAATLVLAGLTLRRNRDYRTAVTLMRQTAACVPTNPRAHANLGAALLDAGRPQEAVAPLLKALSLDPHAGLAYNKLGMAYQLLGQLERSLPFYRRAVELIEDPRCFASLGEVLARKGDHAGAVPAFEAALQLDPAQPAVHVLLAHSLARLQRRDEAIRHCEEALRLEPGFAAARSELAALQAATPERVKAREPGDRARAPR